MSDPRRKVLKESVCLLLSESGFTTATDECIETLVEMLQCRKFQVCLHLQMSFKFIFSANRNR